MNTLQRCAASILTIVAILSSTASAADVFVRFRIVQPVAMKFRVTLAGYRHAGEPWYFKPITMQAPGGVWSEWQNLSDWPWHKRLDRQGGVAEWPTLKITAEPLDVDRAMKGVQIEVELAEQPDAAGVVVAFKESSESRSIAFLVPTPLRENAKEFETGAQMTARHLAWASQALGNRPIKLKRFDMCTSIWGHYDPGLARQDLQTLGMLGFNVVNSSSGLPAGDVKAAGFRMYQTTWLYEADPKKTAADWAPMARRIENSLKSPAGRWEMLDGVAHWVLADEIRTVNVASIAKEDRDRYFREYLTSINVTDVELGRPVAQADYPAALLAGTSLNREADLQTRRLAYYAAKFDQAWSARQLRLTTDLVHRSLPGSKTETLPTDHGFFNAWGPPCIGMSFKLLDLFEVARRQSVDQLSAEDWMGLNHMYGPASTWTGAQTFEYLAAVMRSAIGDRPILLRGLITPSDDGYLRLKAYSALAQGAKSFFFWTYGPTYIGTENYWSDLRSMYDGLAKVNRAIEKSEEVLAEARPVRDRVAILYSVSHDIWFADNPAAFVEKKLLWHALRHLSVQPDFLSEEDVEAGTLKDYKVLYVADWCVSRKASAAIDRWVRDGGVAYLSAGAATRDEFCSAYVPEFAAGVWPADAAGRLKAEMHQYNERVDLPTIKAMGSVAVEMDGRWFEMPVIGCRLDLRTDVAHPIARFADGAPAGAKDRVGKGQVVAMGFCPMLAYGKLAGFKPTTLEEKWPAEPRELVALPLKLASVSQNVRCDKPVVEASLLSGPKGSILVLANYTYRPIESLMVDLKVAEPITSAVSTEGKAVRVEKTSDGVRLRLPLEWTDVVILR